jgi:hypothetical protein
MPLRILGVFLKDKRGSPPVIPAESALLSNTSLNKSFKIFYLSFICKTLFCFFLSLLNEQYQQFVLHFPFI